MPNFLYSLVLLLLLLPGIGRAQSTAPAPRYRMLICTAEPEEGFQARASFTTVEPDGSFYTEELSNNPYKITRKAINATIVRATADSSRWAVRRLRFSRSVFYQAEVQKINEWSSQGWVLVNTWQESPSVVRYLFRQDARR